LVERFLALRAGHRTENRTTLVTRVGFSTFPAASVARTHASHRPFTIEPLRRSVHGALPPVALPTDARR
jgi:hypothetical protein